MDRSNIIESGGFYFIHNFDSGNLGHVERVPTEHIAPSVNHRTNATETPDYEFNLWTRPDCAGTEFENGNRTWFYFGIQASERNMLVRLNLINLNKQGKMYNQGMAPVTRTLPGKPQWERIRDRPVHTTDDNTFTLSFKYRTSDNLKATTFFAFTYPFSFAELQIALNSIDLKMLPLPKPQTPDDIYYHRECLIHSLEGRRVDLLTISSHHGITTEREERLKNLFPENQERPFKFHEKKVIFISARVHPGETPSSFVFNGFLNLLLTRNDPIAIQLRKLYVFKMIPFLNPDGVARGHYRTDTRGVNLNRVYLNPSLVHHPTVYASRALIRYYHFGCEKEDNCEDIKSITTRSIQNISESSELDVSLKKKKTSFTAAYKGDRKLGSSNKNSTTIKQPSTESTKRSIRELSGEETSLAEQVLDMKIHEMPCQTSETSLKPEPVERDSSLLNDNILRSCLGSTVHLSTSEELNIHGNNPLRPLRDTLKNSISLLMESRSSVTGDSLETQEDRLSHVKTGWCHECRAAVSRLEVCMPGITYAVPGYSEMRADSTTFNNIEEYREHQKQQLHKEERRAQELEAAKAETGDVFFCTNCFKRYLISDLNEEIKEVSPSSGASGDDSTPAPPTDLSEPADTGDANTVIQAVPPKEEKSKSPTPKPLNKKKVPPALVKPSPPKEPESGLYLYIDLHGHASKKGIFMYGNHFEDTESSVECMLLPRIMSLNNLHFHFSSCNFTERNMYLKDRRDGMSREGSGRVAVLKATGLVRSYTLECNYNTGRLVNVLPPTLHDGPAAPPPPAPAAPPKYTPHIFEEVRVHYRRKNLEVSEDINPMQVGRSLGASILDLTAQHPNSRIPCSEHRSVAAVREWLRAHARSVRPQLTMSRLRPKTSSPTRVPLYARSKGKVIDERKENTYVGAKADTERKRSPPVFAPRSGHDIINMKIVKKSESVKTPSRTRYLSENEPKTKSLTSKRRSILAIRKPNSKTQVGGIVKAKVSRRGVDDADSPRASVMSAKLIKRSFVRSLRGEGSRCRAMASSSSDEAGVSAGGWEHVASGTALAPRRRPPPAPAAPPRLKKIRLKTGL